MKYKDEKELQDEYQKFITNSESNGGLGYEKGCQKDVSDFLFHVPSLMNFIKRKNPSKVKEVLEKEYSHIISFEEKEKQFFIDYQKEFSNFIYNKMAHVGIITKLKNYKFKFKNKYEFIFFDSEPENNLWVSITELTCLKDRVDLAFCVNGIFFSLMEVKYTYKGQDAQDAVSQISRNFINSIDNSDSFNLYRKSMFLVGCDDKAVYVSKALSDDKYSARFIKEKCLKPDFREDIEDTFEEYSNYRKDGVNPLKTLEKLYSKENVTARINFIDFIDDKDYEDVFKNESTVGLNFSIGPLITPRRKQEDAIFNLINDLKDRISNEKEKDYVLKKEIKIIDNTNFSSEDERQKLKNSRLRFSNNVNADNYLLQYSAGFGKTYIMCWLLSLINNIKSKESPLYDKHNENQLYDKIIIITDRKDLSDQFQKNYEKVNNRENIKKIQDETSGSEDKVRKYLLGEERVFVATVQSFNQNIVNVINKMSYDEKQKIKRMRIAFIIDEVHRTQSGELNERMLDIYNDGGLLFGGGKNLVIGLTATPKKETLDKYGSITSSSYDKKVLFKAFDSYPLKNAIEDGFVLNPLQRLFSLQTPTKIQNTDFNGSDKNRLIYENNQRIKQVATKIADIAKKETFRKINGKGQAMLVTYSINAAKKFRDCFVQENLLDEDQVFILYTESQKEKRTLKSLNPSVKFIKSEDSKSIVNSFLAKPRSIIIVVDMLQTGFDNPNLHTLFLDKVVKDISAVQLACRINRVANGKEDCLIIDSSINNENLKTLPDAFAKYESINYSELLSENELLEYLKKNKKNIINDLVYKDLKRVSASRPENIDDYINKNKSSCEKFLKKATKYQGCYQKIVNVFADYKRYEVEGLGKLIKILLTQFYKERPKKQDLKLLVDKTYLVKNINENYNADNGILSGSNLKGSEKNEGEPKEPDSLLSIDIHNANNNRIKEENESRVKFKEDLFKEILSEKIPRGNNKTSVVAKCQFWLDSDHRLKRIERFLKVIKKKENAIIEKENQDYIKGCLQDELAKRMLFEDYRSYVKKILRKKNIKR